MFWAVPLSDGRFACGRVLQVERGSRVTILAGLMAWVSPDQPTEEALSGASLLSQGTAHIKAITETGGEILGERPLRADSIEPLPMLSHAMPPRVRLVRGFEDLRAATSAEVEALPVLSAWGYNAIAVEAEQYFVSGDTSQWWLHPHVDRARGAT
jgi:hypothetical protein